MPENVRRWESDIRKKRKKKKVREKRRYRREKNMPICEYGGYTYPKKRHKNRNEIEKMKTRQKKTKQT
jgi:hypothetical protein